jgi:hypothetical protein
MALRRAPREALNPADHAAAPSERSVNVSESGEA